MGDWKWLESTEDLQRNTYGYDLDELARGASANANYLRANKLAKYIDWNVTAAVQELAEVREEFSWKPWATDAPFVHRERVIAEIIDVQHFLGNILVAMAVDDEEYEEAYRRKQEINRARAASGTYSAKKGGLSQGSD